MYDSKPVSWDDLPFSQLFLLIKNSYVNEASNELPAENFSDAPYHRFTATMQIDLSNGQEAKDCIDKMCNHNKCTYQTIRTYKPSLKRLWCTDMHCQHQRQPLSTNNWQLKHWVKRNQSTDGVDATKENYMSINSCFKGSKSNQRELYNHHTNFCCSHKGYLQSNFMHNYPLHLTYVLM